MNVEDKNVNDHINLLEMKLEKKSIRKKQGGGGGTSKGTGTVG